MNLLAEDLLLMLLDDEKGSLAASDKVAAALGGAVLAELALIGAVTIEDHPSRWRAPKVHATVTVPEDRILIDAYATVAEKDRTAQDLVPRLGKGLKDDLADRLAERGMLERRRDRVLGMVPRTRWPSLDTTHEDAVRRALTDCLVQGLLPNERTAALVALLAAIDQAHKVIDHDGMSNKDVRRRAKEIADGAWAAKAVRDAVEAAAAAIVAVAVAASTGAATSGG